MLVSIIVPMYNVSKYIEKTIESLINQSNKNFELILVDDGSTDDSYKIANALLKKSDLNYSILKQKNGGVSSARNLGLTKASGKYVFFLDSDDFISEETIQTISKECNLNNDIICWGYNHVNSNYDIIFNYFEKYKFNKTESSGIESLEKILVKKELWICTISAAYRREFLIKNNLYYTNGCINGEDQEFTFKALLNANKIKYINKVLSYYVQRETSITNSFNIRKFDAVLAMQRFSIYLEKNKDHLNIKDYILIENIIRTEKIVQTYYENLYSAYVLSDFKNINMLYNEITLYYPNMVKEITELSNKTNNTFEENLKKKLFFFSPNLYKLIYKLYLSKN